MVSKPGPPGQTGWFPDPTGRFETRYWDGTSWTKAVMRGGTVDTDPEFKVEPAKVVVPSLTPTPSPRQAPSLPPGTADRLTPLPIGEAQSRVANMLAMLGATVTYAAPGRIDATVTSKGQPNVLVTILLVFLWVIPAIVYWVVKSKPVARQVCVTFLAVETGTRIGIQADSEAMAQLAPAFAQLPW
jgi:hypothetical protein